ncbi:hypothetical protein IC007_0247 [Sulfuracidifex tepidarius]|uniref:Uncharacterized protein n=1 Tax=Sulfuracidifex tepidarius TaxID=1294262 RepID=A0A510DZU7_9CREN|nr:hypothetical protein IC007_0247 [Sulfuracidifex tepidarius]
MTYLQRLDDVFADIFMIVAVLFGVTLITAGVELLMKSPVLSYLITALEIEGVALLVSFLANAFIPLSEDNQFEEPESKPEIKQSVSTKRVSPDERGYPIDSDLIPIDRWYDDEKGMCVKAMSKDGGDNFTLCYKQIPNEIDKQGGKSNDKRN